MISAKPGMTLPRSAPILYKLLRVGLFLAIGILILLILDRVQRDTVLTLAQTRPIAQITALVLGVAAMWSIVQAGRIGFVHRRQIAWHMSFRMVGWWGLVGSFAGVAVLIFQSEDSRGMPIGGATRTVGAIIPLIIGIQSAFLLSLDDEPGMEVMLACPRRISWVLLE